MTQFDNRMLLPPFAALRAFEAVGRIGGIRSAAAALRLDHAVISRHIRALEEWVGTALVDRSGGRITLTERGKIYHSEISGALMSIAEATQNLTGECQMKRLVISCVPGLCAVWLVDVLDALEQSESDVGVELCPTDEPLDLNRMEADIDIRYEFNFEPDKVPVGLRGVSIASAPTFPVASPAYIESMAPISVPENLLNANLIHEDSIEDWTAWFNANGVDCEGQVEGMRIWHANLAVDFARRGRGIALANRFLVGSDLKNGDLVDVSSLMTQKANYMSGDYVFYTRVDRWNRPNVAQIRRWIEVHAKESQPTHHELDANESIAAIDSKHALEVKSPA